MALPHNTSLSPAEYRNQQAARTPEQSNISYIDEFSYDRLNPDEADYLRDKAAYVNVRRAMSHQLACEIGNALLEAKERLPGVFLAWVDSEFDFSEDTAENYMNVAKNLPALANPEKYNMRSLYTLAAAGTPQEAIEAAGTIAASGKQVDYETSYILANAPETIRQRYQSEQLSKKQAFSLSRVLNRRTLPPEIKQVALNAGVSHAEAVEYLAETYNRERQTARHKTPSKTYSEIKADGFVLNGFGWSVPLADANARDIERFKVDRQARHIQEHNEKKFDWLQFEGRVVLNEDGQPFVYPVGVDLPPGIEGELVLVQMRIEHHEKK